MRQGAVCASRDGSPSKTDRPAVEASFTLAPVFDCASSVRSLVRNSTLDFLRLKRCLFPVDRGHARTGAAIKASGTLEVSAHSHTAAPFASACVLVWVVVVEWTGGR